MTATGTPTDNVYTRIGVKPFINANIPFSYLGGTLEWPEVRRAMDEASRHTVDIGDLQRAVGKRLAEISGAESGMVTSGAAGSIAAATAACIAGTDPEKIWQLPDNHWAQARGGHDGRPQYLRQRYAPRRRHAGGRQVRRGPRRSPE